MLFYIMLAVGVAIAGGGLFFFNDTATTEIYTLSLHDALPICEAWRSSHRRPSSAPTPASRRPRPDRKSTRLNSSHLVISYAVFCLKKKQPLPPVRTARPAPLAAPPTASLAVYSPLACTSLPLV